MNMLEHLVLGAGAVRINITSHEILGSHKSILSLSDSRLNTHVHLSSRLG